MILAEYATCASSGKAILISEFIFLFPSFLLSQITFSNTETCSYETDGRTSYHDFDGN